tara:strand:- start:34 stop:462 length:429 start_codon:yes stop_codon:yes gene_type:complete
MQDWKVKQKIYHKLNREHDDDLNNVDIEISEDIVNNAIRYFKEKDVGWIYPAKSYMVALCYAFWIMEDYDENFYDVLKDPELLPLDPYFVPYKEDSNTYNEIIGIVFANNKGILKMEGMVPDVRKYYDAELGLESSLSHDSE